MALGEGPPPEDLVHEAAALAAESSSAAGGKGRGKGKTGKPAFGAEAKAVAAPAKKADSQLDLAEIPSLVTALKKQMREAAADMDFERAAGLRDRIRELEQLELMLR
jgi:hypothetical protein